MPKFVAKPTVVEAFEIVVVAMRPDADGSLSIRLSDGRFVVATNAMTARMRPRAGDYWVIQPDGYVYLNPKEVFEGKYAQVPETEDEIQSQWANETIKERMDLGLPLNGRSCVNNVEEAKTCGTDQIQRTDPWPTQAELLNQSPSRLQPRLLMAHIVEGDPANHQLKIEVMDEPGQGNACHVYRLTNFNTKTNPGMVDSLGGSLLGGSLLNLATATGGPFYVADEIIFQNGPIKEVGVNGWTHEALLAILIDRLEGFQAGPYASDYNRQALFFAHQMLDVLQARTRERIERQVEGTNTV